MIENLIGGNIFLKMVRISLVIVVICIGYTLFYFNQYHIEDERASIQSNLTEWENRGTGEEIKLDVLEVTQLDNTNSYIVLFETDNKNIGYAHFLKGWNGHFKIELSGHGTNVVSYEEIKTNNGMYRILVGKNPDFKIHHITAKLINEEFSFTSNVSKDEKFVKYKKLPSDLKQTFPADLTFFDENKNIIQNP